MCEALPEGELTEIQCAGCDGHLGHVFKGEPFAGSPTGVRHCVNSVAVVGRCRLTLSYTR